MRKVLLVFMLSIACLGARAQGCSVCTKAAASLDNKSAKGLNGGILYLAAFPLTILGTLGFIWWRSNRHNDLQQ